MQKKYKYLFLVSVLISLGGCTTKKNTTITRAYHNLTSHYNILFNGQESYRKGMIKLRETFEDDFTELLPVFLYSNKDALSGISADMDRSISKATKLVSMHSISVKPEVKNNKSLNSKEREFLNKKEYNKWVDDAYLLMGKAHFHKKEFDKAKETFNYIIANSEPGNTTFEAQLWLARLANEEAQFRTSEELLNSLTNNLEFPKNLKDDLYTTWADYYIKQQKYKDAISPLEKAIEYTGKKFYRSRYMYLLAQLYLGNDDNQRASEYFNKVVKMNPPYRMAIHAKINRALCYQSSSKTARKDIEKELLKMLKDDKNLEYQDQIYFAVGQLYFKDGNVEEALNYYKKATGVNSDNTSQKAKIYLTIADIYYERPDYVNAQSYYDSTVANITPDYPNYQMLHAKSVSLTNLVTHINTVELNDSVLMLSKMSQQNLYALIDGIIEKLIKEEEEQRLAAQEKAEAEYSDISASSTLLHTEKPGDNWYFYNPTVKNLGHKEFIRIWGERKLEDNWRRRNKSSVSFNEPQITDAEESVEPTKNNSKPELAKVTNNKSREFYLQDIPFTDSAKAETHKNTANALYQMGMIYADDLKDYKRANESFEDLLRRYPAYENRLHVYYKLYTIARNNNDNDRGMRYKQKIVSEFPNSNYAKLLTNPNYITELMAQEKEIFRKYESTYELFKLKNYSQAAALSATAMKDNPNHELYPKYDYIKTFSEGVYKDTLTFVIDLKSLAARYPGTEIEQNVLQMITYLQNKRPEVIQQENRIIAKELYKPSKIEAHYFIYVFDKPLKFDQLIFNVITFNLDNFEELNLEVKKIEMGNKYNMCVVSRFPGSAEAQNYLNTIKNESSIFRDTDTRDGTPAIISESNYAVLLESNKIEQYLIFYRDNYK